MSTATTRGFEITGGDVVQESLLRRARQYAQWLWRDSHYHGTEAVALSATTLCGLWLLCPWDTFSSSPGYAVLARIAPEWAWGLATLLLPSATLVAGAKNQYWLRLAGNLGHVFWFLFIGGFVIMGNPRGWGVCLFGPLTVAAAWAFVRLSGEWEERAAGTAFGRLTARAIDLTFQLEDACRRYRLHFGLVLRGLVRRR